MYQAVPYVILSKSKDKMVEFYNALQQDNVSKFIERYKNTLTATKAKVANIKNSVQLFDPTMFSKLEHTYGFGSSAKVPYVEITFLDPSHDLDNYFMNDVFSQKPMSVTPLVFPDRDKIKKRAQLIKSFNHDNDFDDDVENLDNFRKEMRESMRDLTAPSTSIDEDLKQTSLGDIYWIAYGIGDRANDWSNPILCAKSKCKWDSDGTSGKQITMRFVPNDPVMFRSNEALENADKKYMQEKSEDNQMGKEKYYKFIDQEIKLLTQLDSEESKYVSEDIPLRAEYIKVITAIYALIYKSFREIFFNKAKESRNILLVLPNYYELFKSKWDKDVYDAVRWMLKNQLAAGQSFVDTNRTRNNINKLKTGKDLFESFSKDMCINSGCNPKINLVGKGEQSIIGHVISSFTKGLPIKLMGKSAKENLLRGSETITSQYPDKHVYDICTNDTAKLFESTYNDSEFFLLIELTKFLNPQDDFKELLLDIHRLGVNDKERVPLYEFIEESDAGIVQDVTTYLSPKHKMFGVQNPFISDGTGPLNIIGERSLIYKYLYLRNPNTNMYYFFSESMPTEEDVRKDLGQDYVLLGFNNAYFSKLKQNYEDLLRRRKPSIFGDLMSVPTSPIDIEVTQPVAKFIEKSGGSMAEIIRKNQIPVFSLGLSKSNVLSLNFDMDTIYASIFIGNYGFDKKALVLRGLFGGDTVNKDRTDVFGDLVNEYMKGNIDAVKAKIKKALVTSDTFFIDAAFIDKSLGGVVKDDSVLNAKEGIIFEINNWDEKKRLAAEYGFSLEDEELKEFDKGKDEEFVGFLKGKLNEEKEAYILDLVGKMALMLRDDYPDMTLTPASKPFDSTKAMKDTVDMIQNIGLIGKIKTVPAFSLSSKFRILQYPLVLLGVEPAALVGDNNTKLEKNRVWFNGIYRVSGFKHVIRSKDIYSEFSIYRGGRK